jgi:hypothetical protein
LVRDRIHGVRDRRRFFPHGDRLTMGASNRIWLPTGIV